MKKDGTESQSPTEGRDHNLVGEPGSIHCSRVDDIADEIRALDLPLTSADGLAMSAQRVAELLRRYVHSDEPVEMNDFERALDSLEANLALTGEPILTSAREVTDAWTRVTAERNRQVSTEGWTAAHDDEHENGEMMLAAMCYLGHVRGDMPYRDGLPVSWPWDLEWWKPKTRERDLERAGALMLAERDRLVRSGKYCGHIDQKIGLVLAALASAPQPACVGVLPWIVERSNVKIDWTPIASFQNEDAAREYVDACDLNPFQEANRYRVRALSPAPSPQAGGESVPMETVHAVIRKLGTLYGAAGHDITQARPEDVSFDGVPIIGWRKAYCEGIKDASGCVLGALPETMHADFQAIAKAAAQEEFDRCVSDPSLSPRREG